MQNNNCDGSDHCTPGEVRTLPLGPHSNLIVCHAHYLKEMAYRKERNEGIPRKMIKLGDSERFDLPTWESLKIYTGD